jgi:hypothetical protein
MVTAQTRNVYPATPVILTNPKVSHDLATQMKIRDEKLEEIRRAKYPKVTSEILMTVPQSLTFTAKADSTYGPVVRKPDVLAENKVRRDIVEGQKYGELKRLNIINTDYEEYKAAKKKGKPFLDALEKSTDKTTAKIDSLSTTLQGQLVTSNNDQMGRMANMVTQLQDIADNTSDKQLQQDILTTLGQTNTTLRTMEDHLGDQVLGLANIQDGLTNLNINGIPSLATRLDNLVLNQPPATTAPLSPPVFKKFRIAQPSSMLPSQSPSSSSASQHQQQTPSLLDLGIPSPPKGTDTPSLLGRLAALVSPSKSKPDSNTTPALDARLQFLNDPTSLTAASDLDTQLVDMEENLRTRLVNLKNTNAINVTEYDNEMQEVRGYYDEGVLSKKESKKKNSIEKLEKISQRIARQEPQTILTLTKSLPVTSPQSDLFGLDSSAFSNASPSSNASFLFTPVAQSTPSTPVRPLMSPSSNTFNPTTPLASMQMPNFTDSSDESDVEPFNAQNFDSFLKSSTTPSTTPTPLKKVTDMFSNFSLTGSPSKQQQQQQQLTTGRDRKGKQTTTAKLEPPLHQPAPTPVAEPKTKIPITQLDRDIRTTRDRINNLDHMIANPAHYRRSFATTSVDSDVADWKRERGDYVRQLNALQQQQQQQKQQSGSGIVFYSNPKQLKKKLDLLLASRQAGNDSKALVNEGMQIIDLLLRDRKISQKEHRRIFNFLVR